MKYEVLPGFFFFWISLWRLGDFFRDAVLLSGNRGR
jgi:hypothetical protein